MDSNKDLILRSYIKRLCRQYNIKFTTQYLPKLRQLKSWYCWPDDYFMLVDVLASLTNLSRREYRNINKQIAKIINDGHTRYDKKNRE